MIVLNRAGRSAVSSQLLLDNIFPQRARAHVTPLHAPGQWDQSIAANRER